SPCVRLLTLVYIPLVFFFSVTSTPAIYTLSLHDALPISVFTTDSSPEAAFALIDKYRVTVTGLVNALAKVWTQACEWEPVLPTRSEEHTSELQSRENLVCRLLLEKKNVSKRSH